MDRDAGSVPVGWTGLGLDWTGLDAGRTTFLDGDGDETR